MSEFPQWTFSTQTHRSYSIHIYGDYVGVLFKRMEPFESELVVWSWKTGVQHLNVSIVHASVRISSWGLFVL